jgi:hypothetical protein
MSDRKMNSGSWVVIALLAIGVIAGLAALKFRQFPTTEPTSQPTTASVR